MVFSSRDAVNSAILENPEKFKDYKLKLVSASDELAEMIRYYENHSCYDRWT